MAKIGIFYGSTEGNTERIAEMIQELFGADKADVYNVDSATAEDMQGYEVLLFGASTWEIGELQEDWEPFMDVLDDVDFTGKKVGFFGCGDADGYPDTFIDALGIIYEKIENSGAAFIGKVPTDDFVFDASRAVIDGVFIGLPIDEDNEPDKTDTRVKNWVAQLKTEI
ncbi:MAG: flavodoxin [Cyclobacteriaceae bacterium]|nr:flavodoxin [Cyclobacteriaceae bacterium]